VLSASREINFPLVHGGQEADDRKDWGLRVSWGSSEGLSPFSPLLDYEPLLPEDASSRMKMLAQRLGPV
jgi:hypothetical protein